MHWAAYLTSLNTFDPSPYRNSDGSLTANAVAGKSLFQSLQCGSCHSGANFTNSASGLMHDVGTIKASSGKRANNTLLGIDVPTLRDVWKTAPYLHDGSAATLQDVLTTQNSGGKHGAAASLSSTQLDQLVAYLQQIDGSEPASSPPFTLTLIAPANNASVAQGTPITLSINTTLMTAITEVRYYANGTQVATSTIAPYSATWSNASASTYEIVAKVFHNDALSTVSKGNRISVTSPNNPPVATINANPIQGNAPFIVDFSATVSDPDGDLITGYAWTFGPAGATSTLAAPSYTYISATGSPFTATLVITDSRGAQSAVATKQITVLSSGFTEVTGLPFGTAPWTNCQTCTFDKAFDNNISSYFDANAANGAYTGIDAGSAQVVKRIRYYPRENQAVRMTGGRFQGSNTSSSAGFVDLYVIPTQPTQTWQQVDLPNNNTAYRYLRYLAPNNGYGNVAEIEFYISGSAPDNLSVSSATLSFGAVGGESTITVTSNTGWTVSADEGWVTLDPVNGSGNATINVDVSANSATAGRDATITFTTPGGLSRSVDVTQEGTFSGSTVYLSDLNWTSATNGYGPVEKDESNGENAPFDGSTITLNGVTYAKGLGVHAASTIIYNLGGNYNRFRSDVGVDDERANNVCGSVVFEVYLDNATTPAFTSGIMNAMTAAKNVDVDVTGKNQLRLVVTSGTDGTCGDHGDWAGARLIIGSGSARGNLSVVTIPEPEVLPGERVSVYPNPVKENILNVHIYSDRDVNTKISILSSTSQQAVGLQKTLIKGDNVIQFSTEHLANGLHLIIVNKEYERVVKKVMIDKQ